MSDDESRKIAWGQFALGIGLFAAAIWLYSRLTGLETDGGSMRINWIIVGVYKLLGKWGVVGVTVLAGIALCWRAVAVGKADES